MDPNICLIETLEALSALKNGDEDMREVAVERLRALAQWLERGGFAPDPQRITEGDFPRKEESQ